MDRIPENEAGPLLDLIELLEQREKLSKEQEKALREPYSRRIFETMMATGKTYGETTGSPGIALNTRDETEFKNHLHRIDNDLLAQIAIVREGVDHYFNSGEFPPPYYAWRIGIILRKKKLYDLESRFCEGFSKHFFRGVGTRYIKISERAKKARQLASKTRND